MRERRRARAGERDRRRARLNDTRTPRGRRTEDLAKGEKGREGDSFFIRGTSLIDRTFRKRVVHASVEEREMKNEK